MLDSYSLAEYSSQVLSAPGHAELEQRLGLYRVFLKLYEHHRELLDEILDLENSGFNLQSHSTIRYVQAVRLGQEVYLITNLIPGKPQAIQQEQGIWVIGRDRKAALSLPDQRLSRRHAAIQYATNGYFYLVDLNSTNGSYVNGQAVRQAVCLHHGDQVRLGSLAFTFMLCEATQLAAPLPTELVEQINSSTQAEGVSRGWEAAQAVDAAELVVGWDTELPVGAGETCMFLIPPIPDDIGYSSSSR